MWKPVRVLLRILRLAKKRQDAREQAAATPSTPAATQPSAPPPAETYILTLKRNSTGSYDTLGTLYHGEEALCYTLEGLPGQRLPAGSYPIALRTEGGRDATYRYNFGDRHKGLLWISDALDTPFALIHIGNRHDDLVEGGIVVGTEAHKENEPEHIREVWYSEQAYLKLYEPLAAHLAAGGVAQIDVED